MVAHNVSVKVYDLIDTLSDNKVVRTYATHRRALNASNKLEPEPTNGDRIWRYQIQARNL